MVSACCAGELDQRALQLGEQRADRVDLVAQPEAHVGRDLVVARAAGVQALAGIAGELDQARLDVEVHVLEVDASSRTRRARSPRRSCARPRLIAARSAGVMTLRRRASSRARGCRRCRRATGGGRRRRSPCSASPARSSARRRAPTRPRICCRTGCWTWRRQVPGAGQACASHGLRRRRRQRPHDRASVGDNARHVPCQVRTILSAASPRR